MHATLLHEYVYLMTGSRLTNFVGILSQGLRIAPPEAPATGYMVSLSLSLSEFVCIYNTSHLCVFMHVWRMCLCRRMHVHVIYTCAISVVMRGLQGSNMLYSSESKSNLSLVSGLGSKVEQKFLPIPFGSLAQLGNCVFFVKEENIYSHKSKATKSTLLI